MAFFLATRRNSLLKTIYQERVNIYIWPVSPKSYGEAEEDLNPDVAHDLSFFIPEQRVTQGRANLLRSMFLQKKVNLVNIIAKVNSLSTIKQYSL